MTTPSSGEAFLELVRDSGLADPERLGAYVAKLARKGKLPAPPEKLASYLLRKGFLTRLQCELLLQGKRRGFTLGQYLLLERLGSRSLGSVRGVLCLDLRRRRRVAVTFLRTLGPGAAGPPERVYREAQAATALEHPNIVRAYGYKRKGKQPYLVREYIDGRCLLDLVGWHGPLAPARAAHYVRQAAEGLRYAHAAGVIHRAIHPGNLLLDRQGVVKILDLGLAGFFRPRRGRDGKRGDVKGIAVPVEYLAPEAAAGGDAVDGRADVYGLGATFYFLLTGRAPFEGVPSDQPAAEPTPIRELRTDVSPALAAVVARMMAADPARRYPTPQAVIEALLPHTQGSVPPPSDEEMPHLCAAALRPRFPNPLRTPAPPAPAETPADPGASAEAGTGGELPRPAKRAPKTQLAEEAAPPSEDAGGPAAPETVAAERAEQPPPDPTPDDRPPVAAPPAAEPAPQTGAARKRTRSPAKPRPVAPPSGADTAPDKDAAIRKAPERPDPAPRERTTVGPRPVSRPPAAEAAPAGGPWAPRAAPAAAPRSTTPERRQTRTVVTIAVALGLAVVAVCLAGAIIAANRPKPEPPTIGMDGPQLLREFRANEVEANLKYMGKSMEIRGAVVKVHDEELVVDVGKPEEGYVYCRPSNDAEDMLAQFQKGEQLTVTGKCRGAKTAIRGIQLSDCQFSK